MKITLSYQDALARHSEAVAEILQRQRSSKGQHRDTAPELLSWGYGYNWVISCQSLSPFDMAANAGKKRKELTASEKLAERVASTSAWLYAKSGRSHWTAKHFDVVPAEIVDIYRKDIAKEEAEAARFGALSAEEQRTETTQLLMSLGTSPGFVALAVGKRNS